MLVIRGVFYFMLKNVEIRPHFYNPSNSLIVWLQLTFHEKFQSKVDCDIKVCHHMITKTNHIYVILN